MLFKIKKPVTPSQRQLVRVNTESLKRAPLLKSQIIHLKNTGGRNNSGKITVRHQGGGHKQKYRKINFNRKFTSVGVVCSIEYDPNRNSNISAIFSVFENNFFYIISPKDLQIGDIVKSGENAESKLGHSLPISEIPVGSCIHNVSPKTTEKASISRSAGTFARVVEKTLEYITIELSSGELRIISPECLATIGLVSNGLIFLSRLGKAGQSRWLNRRPTVRGVSMNPIDHPHGGGEGKKSGKGKTPWGGAVKNGFTSRSKNKCIIKKHNASI